MENPTYISDIGYNSTCKDPVAYGLLACPDTISNEIEFRLSIGMLIYYNTTSYYDNILLNL